MVHRLKTHWSLVWSALVISGLLTCFVVPATAHADVPLSVYAAASNYQVAQITPRRKPGDEPVTRKGSEDAATGDLPRRKPGTEQDATTDVPPAPANEPEEKKDQADKSKAEETVLGGAAEEFVWNESDQASSDKRQIWGKFGLIGLASFIWATAFGLAIWVPRWRGGALFLFATTVWIFEFYALGMRLDLKVLAFLGEAYAPIALLGMAGAVMIDAAYGRHLPRPYRGALLVGFGGYFLVALVTGIVLGGLDAAWVKYPMLAAVPFILYAQVLGWGRGVGTSFILGLFALVIAIGATALAPVFVNTGPGVALPLGLHLFFLAGVALVIVPVKPEDEFAEDFYHAGTVDERSYSEPRRFGEPEEAPHVEPHFDLAAGTQDYDEDYDEDYGEDYGDDYGDDDNRDDRGHGSQDQYEDDYEKIFNQAYDEGAVEEIADYSEPSPRFAPPPRPPAQYVPPAQPAARPAPFTKLRPEPAYESVNPTLEDENRYALGIAGAHQGLWDWNIERDELYLSPSVDGMLGLPAGGLKRSEVGWAERVHPDDFDTYRNALRTYITRGNASFDMEFRIRHESGEYVWMKLRATCLPDEGGMAARCVGTIADITTAKVNQDRLSQSTPKDPLTGLANRSALTEKLGDLLSSIKDPEALPSLIVIDLDRFKTVNDSLGQACGDALLQTVARRLEDVTGASGLVSRLGSDEFAILVYKERGMRPGVIAAKALDALARPVELDGHEVFPMASVGLAEAGLRHRKAEDLLKDAETAMFGAKRQGGGCVEVYESTMSHQTVEALSIESDLRRALERHQMEVLYQPIMDFRTDSVAGFEALLRWRHPVHGLMTPDQFVSMAEATDMIVPLGRFVLSMASLQLNQWQKLFPLATPLFVSVNVSSRQLKRVDFADDVREVLETANLLPNTLKLEVTESLIQEDPILAENLLREVKGLGAGIVLDDFGTGFASLSNLQRYPFDTIKVDRSFVSTMDTRPDSHVIVNSIVNLASNLGMTVIAEGLESEDDKHRIRQMGCNFGQGFVFGPPMPAMDAQTFIAHHWAV